MGLFVPRKTWYQLVLPMIEAGPHHGHLTVLYGFIRGTSQEYITEHLEDIGKILSDESVCYTRKVRIYEFYFFIKDFFIYSTEKYAIGTSKMCGGYIGKI